MARPNSPEPKFRRRAEDRPDELLDAALTLFVAQGYAHTSVAQIATAAGVSKGAVYLYFPSKQAILEGLVKRAVTPVADRALAVANIAQGDLRATLRSLLGSIVVGLTDPKVFAVPKIVIREAVIAPEIAQMYRNAVLDRVLPFAIGLIRQGVDSGQLRAVDPELTLRTIMGPIVLHVLLSEIFDIRPERGLALDALAENHLDILLNGLFAQDPESRPDD
ncbi:MAG TPA: TetR/AcrR family transcriptional regulator [Rhodobacteraceae bacterium]|nr:TetR/AcrR family transcriptional regulator [Paracoccaceae bacterium]